MWIQYRDCGKEEQAIWRWRTQSALVTLHRASLVCFFLRLLLSPSMIILNPILCDVETKRKWWKLRGCCVTPCVDCDSPIAWSEDIVVTWIVSLAN